MLKKIDARCALCDYLNQDHPGITEVHSEHNYVVDNNGEPVCTDCLTEIGLAIDDFALQEGEVENLEEQADLLLTTGLEYDTI